MQHKRKGLKLTVAEEGHHFRQLEVYDIRDGFDGDKRKAMRLSGAGNGRAFHVYGVSAIGLSQLQLLFGASNFRIADHDSFCQGSAADRCVVNGGLVPTAISRINDRGGENSFAELELGRQTSGD